MEKYIGTMDQQVELRGKEQRARLREARANKEKHNDDIDKFLISIISICVHHVL